MADNSDYVDVDPLGDFYKRMVQHPDILKMLAEKPTVSDSTPSSQQVGPDIETDPENMPQVDPVERSKMMMERGADPSGGAAYKRRKSSKDIHDPTPGGYPRPHITRRSM